MAKIKLKKCRQCFKEFKPYNSLAPVCSLECALKYNSEKEVKKRVKVMKRELTTYSDYMNVLQKVFNQFIRLRDKDKDCICCPGVKLVGLYDAGHFLSVGAYPNLRVNEDNVHGQRRHCNSYLHGRLLDYRKGLIQRIGIERFRALEEASKHEFKPSIPEIKELIEHYKTKIKELK